MNSAMVKMVFAISMTAAATQTARGSEYSPAYESCMETSGGVTVQMLDCNAAEHAQQDARLNHFYGIARRQLDPSQRNLLVAAQRAWIVFRDNDCNLIGGLTGGTMDSLNASGCYLERTRSRADDLQWLVESN